MSEEPPAFRDDFVSPWDRCVYLLDSLRYWFWTEEDEPKSQEFACQIVPVLEELDPHGTTVLGAEGWALVMATRNDWRGCLQAKRHHIDMLRFLLAEGVPPEVTEPQDLVIAAEEYVLLARAGGDLDSVDSLVAVLLADGFLDAKQRAFLRDLLQRLKRRCHP
jgi:hypothetical protein